MKAEINSSDDLIRRSWFVLFFVSLFSVVSDLTAGLSRWRLWVFLARHDLVNRYKRSWLGLTWVFLSFSLFVVAKVLVFGTLAGKGSANFAVYLSVGYMLFKLISAVIVDGANSFTASENWIKGESIPLTVYIYRSVMRNFMVSGMTMPTVLVVCAWFGAYNVESVLTFPLVLLIYVLNAVWISLLLGVICTRFRDVSHLVAMGMSLTYFLTPVLWVTPDSGVLATIAAWNPFTYFIDIMRAPLLGEGIPSVSWAIVCGITVGGIVITTIVYGIMRDRIIYWL